mgnify:CR=1 FL=1
MNKRKAKLAKKLPEVLKMPKSKEKSIKSLTSSERGNLLKDLREMEIK